MVQLLQAQQQVNSGLQSQVDSIKQQLPTPSASLDRDHVPQQAQQQAASPVSLPPPHKEVGSEVNVPLPEDSSPKPARTVTSPRVALGEGFAQKPSSIIPKSGKKGGRASSPRLTPEIDGALEKMQEKNSALVELMRSQVSNID